MVSRVSRFLCLLAGLTVLLHPLGLRGQFAQPAVVKTGNWPAAIYTADFNGDGRPDLVYLDHGATAVLSTAHVLLGDGKGGFTQSATVTTAGASIAIGDFDGDGRLDLGWIAVTSGTCNGFGTSGSALLQMYVAPGNGAGGFGPATALFPGAGAPPINCATPSVGNLAAAKIFASGPAAIVYEDAAHGILYANYFGHTPYDGTNADATVGADSFTIADVNGDGLDDYITGNSSTGNVNVFLSLGTGHFDVPKAFHVSGPILSLKVQEVDNDTYPDLVIEGTNGRFDIYHGNGDGTFSTQSEGGSGTLDGTTGNGGHLIGITTLASGTRHNFITATPAGVSVLVGQGNLTYVLKGIYNAGPGRGSYALADFNGDGNLDLAVDSPEGIAILYGNADGSFQSGKAYPTTLPASSGALGALTNSGHLDAIAGLSSTDTQVLLGQGDGSFVPVGGANTPKTVGFGPLGQPPGYMWSTVGMGDIDGDGRTDIVTTYDAPAGTATNWTAFATVQFNEGLNDGQMKATAGVNDGGRNTYGTGAVGHFLGSGSAGLTSLNTYNLLVSAPYVPLVPDLVHISFGDTSDAIGVAYASDVHAHNLTVAGDLNHDGADDLVVQHNGLLTVYLSLKNGSFQKVSTTVPVAPYVASTWGGVSQTYNEPAFPGSMAIADLNGDGFGDLVVAYDDLGADHTQPTAARPNHILVWLGNGDGTFKGPATIVPTRNFYQIALADLDGDGHPDLAMHDGYVLSVQFGKGDGSFGPEQHYLAGMGLNTISAGDVNGDGKIDLVVANGGTFFGNPVANHEAPVANPDVNTGGVTVLLNTAATVPVAATGTIAATPNPVAYNGSFTVTIALNGSPAPTGTVTFTIDGSPAGGSTAGTVALTNGSAVLSFPAGSFTTPLTPGAHALMAVYAGDANYTGVTLKGTLTVGLAPTSVTLTATTALQVYYGQGIDGTFFITASFPTTGTYTVLDNGVAVAICANLPVAINGVPDNCPYGNPVLVDAGPHNLAVAYNGDSQNAPSVSAAIPYVVLPDLTMARLVSAPNPSTLGQAVTFTATLTGNTAVPSGVVTFFDAGTPIGTATLNAGGIATLTTSALSLGTHTITASYAATVDFNAAASNAVSQQVNPPTTPQATAVQLTSSLNPAPAGFGVTFTATVVTSGSFAVVPSGTVSFLDGGVTIGTGVLNSLGVATFTTAALKIGSHALTASYAGAAGSSGGLPPPSPPKPPVRPLAASAKASPTLLASVSPVLTEVITTPMVTLPASFSVSVTPDPVYVPAGQDAVLSVRVLVQGNFTQTIQLGCSGLPAEASCVFVNPTVGSAGGTTTLYVLPQGPHGCGANGAPYYGLLGLFGLLFVRKRRRLGVLLAVVCLLGLAGLSGCGSGNCTDLGVIPGNYNFTVTGTPSAGPVTGVQGWIVGMKVTLP